MNTAPVATPLPPGAPGQEPITPQALQVLNYLRADRTLTQLLAMNVGIANLTTRIAELRKLGWDIRGLWKKDTEGRRYKSYRLGKNPE